MKLKDIYAEISTKTLERSGIFETKLKKLLARDYLCLLYHDLYYPSIGKVIYEPEILASLVDSLSCCR